MLNVDSFTDFDTDVSLAIFHITDSLNPINPEYFKKSQFNTFNLFYKYSLKSNKKCIEFIDEVLKTRQKEKRYIIETVLDKAEDIKYKLSMNNKLIIYCGKRKFNIFYLDRLIVNLRNKIDCF